MRLAPGKVFCPVEVNLILVNSHDQMDHGRLVWVWLKMDCSQKEQSGKWMCSALHPQSPWKWLPRRRPDNWKSSLGLLHHGNTSKMEVLFSTSLSVVWTSPGAALGLGPL